MTPISRRTWLLAAATCCGSAVLRAGEAAWPEETSAGVFRCHADFSLKPFGGLIEELGSLEDDLRRELDVPPPREEIHLFLFNRKTTYQAYLNQYFPKAPARKALFIKGRGPGMVFVCRSAELATDVRHEGTHALLHTLVREIPLWLDEGLAEYFEVPADERVTGSPYVSAVRWNARLGHVPDLEKLERLRDLSEMGRNEYRDAWAWTHFLLHAGDETRAVLREYLQLLASGEDAGALGDHLRRRVADPPALFTAHFRRWSVAH